MGTYYYYFKWHRVCTAHRNIAKKKIAMEISQHQNENVTASHIETHKMPQHIIILYLRCSMFMFFFHLSRCHFSPKIELMEEEREKKTQMQYR